MCGRPGQRVGEIEHFQIYAYDHGDGELMLTEDVDGKDVAIHLRDHLAQRIGISSK